MICRSYTLRWEPEVLAGIYICRCGCISLASILSIAASLARDLGDQGLGAGCAVDVATPNMLMPIFILLRLVFKLFSWPPRVLKQRVSCEKSTYRGGGRLAFGSKDRFTHLASRPIADPTKQRRRKENGDDSIRTDLRYTRNLLTGALGLGATVDASLKESLSGVVGLTVYVDEVAADNTCSFSLVIHTCPG